MRTSHQSLVTSHQSLLIGVDGNEANVEYRVGSNQYAFELLHALHDLPQAKKHEWVVYLRDKPLADMPPQRKGWVYKVFGPKRLWTQIALPISLFGGKRPDIFFTPGHYRPRWSPIPTVISVMDLGYLVFPDQFTKRDLMQLKRWTGNSIKKANHILSISESTKRDIMKYYDVPSDRVTVTHLGYDSKNFKFQISNFKLNNVRRKYKIKNDYILFLSTLKPSKNIEELVEAFASLANDSEFKRMYANLQLVISGKKGWMFDSIFEKVKEIGLEKKVIFTDFVADDDVPALMAGAKIFVLPSFWEGFGIPVVEAMAVGTPVVVSNVASLPEIVGDAGVLVNPNKSDDIARGIKEALENHDLLSKRGLAQAKKFSWENCAKQTLHTLEMIY